MSTASATPEIATFAAGCFWGVEHIFLKHYPPAQNKGILKTAVGYTGGKVDNPTYGEVCSTNTGHAEALRIEFDPSVVSYKELVEFFFRTHDPRVLNKQGADSGTQYRSAVFTHSPEQTRIAEEVKSEVQASHMADYEKAYPLRGPKTIVTQVVEAGKWYDAEEYHQLYLFNNPDGYQCASHRLYW